MVKDGHDAGGDLPADWSYDQLGHLLLSERDGSHVFSWINDWLETTHQQRAGRPFKLDYRVPIEATGASDGHAAY